jgi:methyl-accepting chemotaxis protein
MDVLNAGVSARATAMQGEAPALADLEKAIATLGQVDAELGGDLETTDAYDNVVNVFSALKADNIEIATVPATAYERWTTFNSAVLTVMAIAGDKSNLILDPDLDSFYLMDTIVVKLPTLIEAVGQLHAQSYLPEGSIACGSPTAAPQVAAYALCFGSGTNTLAGMKDGLGRSIAATSRTTVDSTLSPLLADLEGHTNELLKLAGGYVENSELLADEDVVTEQAVFMTEHLGDITETLVTYYVATAGELDGMIETRVAGFAAGKSGVINTTVPFLIVVGYLFLGFYVVVRGNVRRVAEVLNKVRNNDFTGRVVIDTRDEFASLGRNLNDTIVDVEHAHQMEHDAIVAISSSTDELHSASTQLSGLAQEMAGLATETAAQATTVASATDLVSANVSSVAAGVDQMRASVGEISRGASQATGIASSGVEAASATSETIMRLHEASAEIGKVTDLISSIAKQTNLLALNATIEAARAGDAGKGFAVVANEVKELATESSKAADDIRDRIATIQAVTNEAVSAIENVGTVIAQINEAQISIAAAVEEQNVTNDEIARSINSVVVGISEIASNIGGVAEAATMTASNAEMVNEATRRLDRVAGALEEEEQLLTEIESGQLRGRDVPSAEQRFGATPAKQPTRA